MGEIAEMMLNGTLCECCGVYLEDGEQGFPSYCSKQCAIDRGIDMKDPNNKFYIDGTLK